MLLQSLSTFWGVAQAVADHLWQSNLFVAAAGSASQLRKCEGGPARASLLTG